MIAWCAQRRWLLAAALVVAAAAAVGGYRVHEEQRRQRVLQELIEDSCDACTLRHQAQLRLRDLLRRQRAGETPGDSVATPPDAAQ